MIISENNLNDNDAKVIKLYNSIIIFKGANNRSCHE